MAFHQLIVLPSPSANIAANECDTKIADNTHYRSWLINDKSKVKRRVLKNHYWNKLKVIYITNTPAIDIHYPVEQYPEKVKSINLDKEGVLQCIKGQYLMLDGDRIINMRKYSGYDLSITTE